VGRRGLPRIEGVGLPQDEGVSRKTRGWVSRREKGWVMAGLGTVTVKVGDLEEFRALVQELRRLYEDMSAEGSPYAERLAEAVLGFDDDLDPDRLEEGLTT
jgi:hypothetical protein